MKLSATGFQISAPATGLRFLPVRSVIHDHAGCSASLAERLDNGRSGASRACKACAFSEDNRAYSIDARVERVVDDHVIVLSERSNFIARGLETALHRG